MLHSGEPALFALVVFFSRCVHRVSVSVLSKLRCLGLGGFLRNLLRALRIGTSTISLKRGVAGPLLMCPQGAFEVLELIYQAPCQAAAVRELRITVELVVPHNVEIPGLMDLREGRTQWIVGGVASTPVAVPERPVVAAGLDDLLTETMLLVNGGLYRAAKEALPSVIIISGTARE